MPISMSRKICAKFVIGFGLIAAGFALLTMTLTVGSSTSHLPQSKVNADTRDRICALKSINFNCTPSRFRTIDGSCNNRANPLWGTPFSPYARLLPSNGTQSTNHRLPNARTLSKKLFGSESRPSHDLTLAMMQYGQFIAHDMSFTVLGDAKSCCSESGRFASTSTHCSDIEIPTGDEFYGARHATCMEFVATVTEGDLRCKSRENPSNSKLSAVTSFLDLSLVYGNDEQQSRSLRALEGGLLRTETINDFQWPPHDPNATDSCYTDSQADACFQGGDERLNQSPHLTAIHVLFVREHNRVATQLARLNPRWDDERVFQEARRVCVGQHQFVAYCEWLPLVLGEENARKLRLVHSCEGDHYVSDYDASVNAAVLDEHAHAASRFFHTLIEGVLEFRSESGDKTGTIAMGDHFDNPAVTVEHFDELARGMVTQMAQDIDTNFDAQTREFLFKRRRTFGDDLRAIDIQRARDHGVASYNEMRRFCGLQAATSWDDFRDLIAPEELEKLREIYENFNDVELSVGALLEARNDSSALAGPTVLCILGRQFLNTRVGDRFWFETGDPEVAFTRPQLAELRRSSFAKILCANGGGVRSAQRMAFRAVGAETNPIVPCSEIPPIDLSKWRE